MTWEIWCCAETRKEPRTSPSDNIFLYKITFIIFLSNLFRFHFVLVFYKYKNLKNMKNKHESFRVIFTNNPLGVSGDLKVWWSFWELKRVSWVRRKWNFISIANHGVNSIWLKGLRWSTWEKFYELMKLLFYFTRQKFSATVQEWKILAYFIKSFYF